MKRMKFSCYLVVWDTELKRESRFKLSRGADKKVIFKLPQTLSLLTENFTFYATSSLDFHATPDKNLGFLPAIVHHLL